MTQDLGIGADLDAVLAAPAAEVPARVDAMWSEKDATSFATRAGAIADGIAKYRPDLVALHSVIAWGRQIPASASPADETALDYLAVLLEALSARGLPYAPIVVITTADLELTGASGNDYRLVDREVILAWTGLETREVSGGTYAARRTISLGDRAFEDLRGWASARVAKNGREFRFVSTRLEATDGDVQRAQTVELERVLAQDVPTIVAGDLASEIVRADSPGHDILLARGSSFYDVVANAGAGFPSCCRDALLVDPGARLDRRTDFVLVTGEFVPSWGAWVHGNGTAMVSGLWPSSHAGVLAGMWLR